MKNFLFYSLLCGFIFTGFGCEDCEDPTNPECENYDPCFEVTSLIEPNFEMGTIYSFSPPIKFAEDTVAYGGVYFEANIADAISYEWKIGTDNRTWDTPAFVLSFSDKDSFTLRNDPVLVTLIIHQELNDCFPENDGIDTISRYLHFRPKWESALWGTWEGYRDDLTDNIYQLKFGEIYDPPGSSWTKEIIHNLYGNSNGIEDCYNLYNGFLGYRSFTYGGQSNTNWEICGEPYRRWTTFMNISVNTTDNTISMTWEEWRSFDDGSPAQKVTDHYFKGNRVN